MTVSLFSSGIQTGTIGSEIFITNVNEVGRFQLYLSLGNMASGDFLEVRTYQTILSSGTADPVQFATFQGAQPPDALVGYTLPIGNDLQESQSLRYSIKQTLGTARTYNWKVLNLDKFPNNFPVLGIDSLGRVSTVVNLVSGSTGGGASAADIWGYVGGRTLTSPQNWDLIGNISGSISRVIEPVVAVQGGFVTVSGSVNIVQPVIASVVQGGYVTVSGTVEAVRGGFVTVSGAVVADVRSLVGVSGTVLASAVQSLVGISGTVEAIRGGFVTVSGTVEAVRGGYVTVSGSTSFDPALVWAFTGSRSLNGPQTWNLDGYVGMVTGSVMSVVSGTAASFDPALVWGFTGSRSLNGLQNWNLVGNISGTLTNVFNVISGTPATVNPADIWGFTGSRSLNGLQLWNLNGYVGMVTGSVMSVISGTAASFDPALVWSFTGSRSLNGLQNWNLVGNISGTITGLAITVTGVSIDVASVWGYPVRTLTSQIFNLPPIEQGNNLTILRGDTLTWNPTALGSLLNHSKIYFSVKRKYTDLDSEALIKVSDVNGLLVINSTPAGTPANASITINNVNTGDITIVVKAVETAKLDTLQDIYYDVQLVRIDGSVTTLVYGLFTILGDSSRTTS